LLRICCSPLASLSPHGERREERERAFIEKTNYRGPTFFRELAFSYFFATANAASSLRRRTSQLNSLAIFTWKRKVESTSTSGEAS
jgi:hypothetical protein